MITDGASRAYQALLAGQDTILLSLIEMVAMHPVCSLYACLRGKKDRLVLDLKIVSHQDEYEANGITGVMVLTKQQILLLKRNADETDQANR